MKRTLVPLAAAAALLSACADNPVQPAVARAPAVHAAVLAGGGARHVVEFKGAARSDFAAQVASLGGTVDYVVDRLGFAGVSGLDAAAAATLARGNGVAAVYDDAVFQLDDRRVVGPMQAAAVSPMSAANPAAAIGFGLQWNLRAISAHTAWAAGHLGSPNVTAAILDSGMDYDSYDLNGLVDLSRSTSFVPGDDAFIAALLPGRHPIDDLGGHGTNVATQVSSNGTVFAGVSSRTRLMGVKVIGRTGSGTIGAFLAGLVWAADHGADVANLSLGIPMGVDKAGEGRLLGLTNRVFNYAHQAGMVVVVAAGNDSTNLDRNGRNFAAYCEAPHVICVSGTGPAAGADPFFGPWANVDAPASYSNVGRQSVTLSAPGGTAVGWVSSVCARHLAIVAGGAVMFPCNAPPGFFFLMGAAGTSQAAPHVTGVVAQLIAKYGKGKPSQIKQLLLRGVDDLGPAGPDAAYGAGRVNLAKALGL